MSLVFLLGRHGAGKSRVGAAMSAHGFMHLSTGMLRRLARSGNLPADIPVSLMLAMRRLQPGNPMPIDVAEKFLRHARRYPDCVIDGFPATPEHLDLLPDDATLCLLWTPADKREHRLRVRSDTSQRIWTPGRYSEREARLADVIRQARSRWKVQFVSNRLDGEDAVRRIASGIASRAKPDLRA